MLGVGLEGAKRVWSYSRFRIAEVDRGSGGHMQKLSEKRAVALTLPKVWNAMLWWVPPLLLHLPE